MTGHTDPTDEPTLTEAEREREHFAQVARDTFAELRSVTAERDGYCDRLAQVTAAKERAEALADEWESTRYKLPPGYPMTVDQFCRHWFVTPLRAALAEPTDAAQTPRTGPRSDDGAIPRVPGSVEGCQGASGEGR